MLIIQENSGILYPISIIYTYVYVSYENIYGNINRSVIVTA